MMSTDSPDSRLQLIQRKQLDELAAIISQIDRENPEILRLLACGILDALECRLGGQCYCGKLIEERDILNRSGTLLQALEFCLHHFEEENEKDRQRVINQIRDQWPPGLLTADPDAEKNVFEDSMEARKSALAG